MFKTARLKLTTWYLAIIMTVTISFSLFVFNGVNEITMRALEAQKRRLEKQMFIAREMPFMARGNPMIDTETILEIRTNTRDKLILINIIVFVVAGSLGYFLAGKTLDPIETMVKKQKRFISDAAHEIKTPLTAMKTTLEVALRDKNISLQDTKETLQSSVEEIDKLNNLTARLLSKSRYQFEENLNSEIVDVKNIIINSIEKLQSIADIKGITIKTNLTNLNVSANKLELEEYFF